MMGGGEMKDHSAPSVDGPKRTLRCGSYRQGTGSSPTPEPKASFTRTTVGTTGPKLDPGSRETQDDRRRPGAPWACVSSSPDGSGSRLREDGTRARVSTVGRGRQIGG